MKHETKILVIDVTKPNFLSFYLLQKKRGAVFQKKYRGERQNLLLRIDEFLKAAKSSLEKLNGLALIEGGGSFSGVRQAAAVLNTIAFVRRLPVAGFDFRKYESFDDIWRAAARHFNRSKAIKYLTPIYSGEPNISI